MGRGFGNLRLLIDLRAVGAFPYDLAYHRGLQGFIYRLLKQAGYAGLHDRAGPKFFTFSNIIPPSRWVPADSRRKLIVASPDEPLIRAMHGEVRTFGGVHVETSRMTFRVEGSRLLDARLPDGYGEIVLTAGTPIVIRIPRYRLEEYGIVAPANYDYVYWRKEHTPTPFIKQLEENLLKKYREYTGKEVDEDPFVGKLGFKKQVAVPLRTDGKETTIIGTLWDFYLQPLNGQKRDLVQFGLDAGFGEMNSLGFGFMNMHEQGRFYEENS